MFKETNDFPNMRKFIEKYHEVRKIFKRHEIPDPFIYRSQSKEYADRVIFIIPVDEEKLRSGSYCLARSLYDSLQSYVSVAFSIFSLDDLTQPELQMLSSPSLSAFLLTEDLSAQTLETKLRQLFQAETPAVKTDFPHMEEKAISECNQQQLLKYLKQPQETGIITQIDIQSIIFDLDIFLALCEFVKTSSWLKQLCLAHTYLNEMHAAVLSNAIEHNTSLTALDVSHNFLGQSVGYFGKLLENNTTLRSLDIGDNQTDDSITDVFSHAVEKNTTLTHLGLSECLTQRQIPYGGLLEQLVLQARLTALDISYNQLSAQCVQFLLEAIIYKKLKLHTLDLSGNLLTEDQAVWLLSQILRDNYDLHILKLNKCGLDSAAFRSISSALVHSRTLNTLELGGNTYSYHDLESFFPVLLIPQHPLRSLLLYISSIKFKNKIPEKENSNEEKTKRFYKQLSYYDETLLYRFITLLHTSTSLRHLILDVGSPLNRLPEIVFRYLKKNTTLEHMEIVTNAPEKQEEMRLNGLLHKSRHKMAAQRKDFLFILISLNHFALWKVLPWDIKNIILHQSLLKNRYSGKLPLQLIGCAQLLSRQTEVCDALLKSYRKITVLEKCTYTEKGPLYSFRFYQPPAPYPITISCHKNMPLTLALKKG